MNLLLIDEDESFSNILGSELKHRQFSVQNANNVSDALKILYESKIDLILTSAMLHDTKLAALVCSIKGRYPKTPLILLSGNEPDYEVKTALMLGADALVPKSINVNQLQFTISRFTA